MSNNPDGSGTESQQKEDIPISTDDSSSIVLELIYQMKIKDVMLTPVITGRKDQTLRHLQALMRENRITSIPIVEEEEGKLVGIISIYDIVTALDQSLINCLAEERMTTNVIVLQDDMPLSFAISYLNKYSHNLFPVLNKNQELVGTLGSVNVIRALLAEMNREVLRLEKLHKKTDITSLYAEMEYAVPHYNFELAGRASTDIKKALKQRNYDPKIVRRIAIASYELEINLVVHSNGGVIHYSILPDKVIITASDTGPGIADVNQALQEGWSTANDYVRSLGFGAGMGLANTKRVSDEFSINSELGVGTTVVSTVYVHSSKEEK
jgi:CBS domain-containing protein